jgi:hypothetical protein
VNSIAASSDATKKENFQPVDGNDVLNKIRGLALTAWNFIGQDAKQFRHYGPTAQEFFAAFGHDCIGTIGTPTTITSTDMEGVLMIAAQALERRTAEQRKEIDALRAENANLRARLEALERASATELRTRLEDRSLPPLTRCMKHGHELEAEPTPRNSSASRSHGKHPGF